MQHTGSRMGVRTTRPKLSLTLSLFPLFLLALAAVAHAEADGFLVRDGNVAPAETYLDSDGAVQSDKPVESPWDTFADEAPPPAAERWEIPGPWSLRATTPQVQTLVAGPTFRNQKNRIEVGAGFGYINSKWRFPFEVSVEPTYRRNKNVSSGDRDFSRVRTFGLVNLWNRSSNWESTSAAGTIFYDSQSDSFNTLEVGGSVSETIGRRLSLSANLIWGGRLAARRAVQQRGRRVVRHLVQPRRRRPLRRLLRAGQQSLQR